MTLDRILIDAANCVAAGLLAGLVAGMIAFCMDIRKSKYAARK
jgi:hypothetical protein